MCRTALVVAVGVGLLMEACQTQASAAGLFGPCERDHDCAEGLSCAAGVCSSSGEGGTGDEGGGDTNDSDSGDAAAADG